MTKVLLLAAALFSASASFAGEAVFLHDSSTTLGKAVIIINPRLRIADQEARILSFTSIEDKIIAGNGFCLALGYKSGYVGDINVAEKPTLMVKFDESSNSLDIVNARHSIQMVTCQKE